jgi:hypothetical protein
MAVVCLLAAGCGDEGSGSAVGSQGDAGGTTRAPVTPKPAAPTPAGTTATLPPVGGKSGDPSSQSIAGICRQSVKTTPGIPPETAAELERLCGEAAGLGLGGAREVREFCEKVAAALDPGGVARDEVRAACMKRATSP